MTLSCEKELARSTIKILLADRDEDRFKLFCEKVKDWAGKYDAISGPTLPRRTRNAHNHHYAQNSVNIAGYFSKSDTYHPKDIKIHYRLLYFECINMSRFF